MVAPNPDEGLNEAVGVAVSLPNVPVVFLFLGFRTERRCRWDWRWVLNGVGETVGILVGGGKDDLLRGPLCRRER